jgi:putative two-component system response regulator
MTSHSPILCVDDEPINLGLLRDTLQDYYPLIFAKSGAGAIELVHKHSPALILLDVMMPEMNGFEVARRLKSDPATEHIPIIFVTRLSDEVDEQKGFEAGGVDYITKPISPCTVRARVKTHLSLVQISQLEASHSDAIHMLGIAGHYNDTDTGVHIWRMAAYSHLLALTVGWDEDRAKLLKLAAPMHDTGKIGIPDAVLKKRDKLNAEEWEIMKQHPRIGYDILSTSHAPLFKLAAEIALSHHEKWDGSGYPNGLVGENIPEPARIVAIADIFDALSMRRPYKESWTLDLILSTMNEYADKHLEKRLVDAFFSVLPQVLEIKEEWGRHVPDS